MSSAATHLSPQALLEAKVRFLVSAAAHAGEARPIEVLETHMSWIFFVGEHVLKLKKPVRFPYLDFSTLAAREFYCREECRLNSRLAPGVYLGLLALRQHDATFALVQEDRLRASGETVDWLVRMRRLPAQQSLQRCIAEARVQPPDIDALLAVLAAFYRSAPKASVSPQEFLARRLRELATNRELLLRPRFQLPGAAETIDRLDAALLRHAALLSERAAQGRVTDGHGDLRPEHVWLLDPPVVIDCLEFNATLREVDPFEEIAFLALECEMAGAPWIRPRLVDGLMAALQDRPAPALLQLYTAQLALRRARLAMAHLLDPLPRTPQRWQPLAQDYLNRAASALDSLPSAGTPVQAPAS